MVPRTLIFRPFFCLLWFVEQSYALCVFLRFLYNNSNHPPYTPIPFPKMSRGFSQSPTHKSHTCKKNTHTHKRANVSSCNCNPWASPSNFHRSKYKSRKTNGRASGVNIGTTIPTTYPFVLRIPRNRNRNQPLRRHCRSKHPASNQVLPPNIRDASIQHLHKPKELSIRISKS